MGRLEELRELRSAKELERSTTPAKQQPHPTLCEFLYRDSFADGSERITSDYKVEKGLGSLLVTFYEHMEGWKLTVEVTEPEDVADQLERALNDLEWPRQPYKTYKELPRWWKELQKKNGHKA